jgi:hypothetical protein
MCAALRKAKDLAEHWVVYHPSSFPPVIVNTTNGLATDVTDEENQVELVQAAKELVQVKAFCSRPNGGISWPCLGKYLSSSADGAG